MKENFIISKILKNNNNFDVFWWIEFFLIQSGLNLIIISGYAKSEVICILVDFPSVILSKNFNFSKKIECLCMVCTVLLCAVLIAFLPQFSIYL